MNIFYLDQDVKKCAQAHCDKHVVKMILESAQLLSTAHHVLGGNGAVYKKTHENHPCAIWVRESRANYYWLWLLMVYLGQEYTYRYDKIHKTITDHKENLKEAPNNLLGTLMTPFKVCMPDYCKVQDNPVESYRNYYVNEKRKILNYTKREKPKWILS